MVPITRSAMVLPRGARRGEDLGKTDGLHPSSKLSRRCGAMQG